MIIKSTDLCKGSLALSTENQDFTVTLHGPGETHVAPFKMYHSQSLRNAVANGLVTIEMTPEDAGEVVSTRDLHVLQGHLDSLHKKFDKMEAGSYSGWSGTTGKPGTKGEFGFSGWSGIPGKHGSMGMMGPKGMQGLSGWSGRQGQDGKDGRVGARGERGDRGEKGEAGRDGRDGKDGISGYSGQKGTPGKDGLNGVQGFPGKDGLNGAGGPSGYSGFNGRDGRDGVDGRNGMNGTDGQDGVNGSSGQSGWSGRSGKVLANMLANGGCDLINRLPLGDAMTQFASGQYFLDRWFVVHNNSVSACRYNKLSASAPVSFPGCFSYGAIQANGLTGFLVGQIIPARKVTMMQAAMFQMSASATVGNVQLSYGMMYWNGPADDPSARTSISMGANGPAFGPGYSPGVVQQVALTPTWQDFGAQGAPPATGNILVYFWTNQLPAGEKLLFSKLGAYESASDWNPRDPVLEEAECLQYFEMLGGFNQTAFGNGQYTLGKAEVIIPLKARKRASQITTSLPNGLAVFSLKAGDDDKALLDAACGGDRDSARLLILTASPPPSGTACSLWGDASAIIGVEAEI